MSSRSKGSGYEKRASEDLDAMGYLWEKARPTIFWKPGPGGVRPMSVAHDFFSAFDFNGIHATLPDIHIQVTDHTNRGHRKAKVLEAMRGRSSNPHHVIAVWTYGKQDRLGFHRHVEHLVDDAWVEIGDFKYDGTPIGNVTDLLYTRLPVPSLPTPPLPTDATG